MKGKLKTYRYYALKKRNWPRLLIISSLIITIGVGAWFYSTRSLKIEPEKLNQNSTGQTTEEAKPRPQTLEGRYLFTGTIVLARAVERGALTGGKYDYSQPFSKMASFEPEKYDGWLTDLECPVTTNIVSYEQQQQNLIFNCRTEWLPEFSKYFKFVNLANNHTNDMGGDGFLETQKNLEAAGVQTIGNYRPTVTKDNCEVMSMPVRIKMSDNSVTKGNLPLAMCAFHYFSFRPSLGEMEAIERYAKVMPVFGLMHVGVEYLATAGADQQNIAHRMIDLGSEFVIGNSPHWAQNSEAYKGKLIAYSTGNFIFDQLDAETNRGLNMDVTFNTPYNENLKKWLALGEGCKARGDTCLEQAESLGLTKIGLTYKFAPIASSGGNRTVTQKASPSVQAGVEQRLDWANVSRALGQ